MKCLSVSQTEPLGWFASQLVAAFQIAMSVRFQIDSGRLKVGKNKLLVSNQRTSCTTMRLVVPEPKPVCVQRDNLLIEVLFEGSDVTSKSPLQQVGHLSAIVTSYQAFQIGQFACGSNLVGTCTMNSLAPWFSRFSCHADTSSKNSNSLSTC